MVGRHELGALVSTEVQLLQGMVSKRLYRYPSLSRKSAHRGQHTESGQSTPGSVPSRKYHNYPFRCRTCPEIISARK